jgi:arginyl-tRNA synthetase
MVKQKIEQSLIHSLKNIQIDFEEKDLLIEQPDDLQRGDYTTNIAMQLASKLKQNPRELAQKIIDNINEIEEIEKIEMAGPGFINFYLSTRYLLTQIQKILDNGAEEYIKSDTKKGENILIEYTDANPFKVFHIGHVYTNNVGEAFSRLQETTGANVKRANYQGDIGLHVAKTMWGIEYLFKENSQSIKDIEQLDLSKRVEFLGEAYMTGAQYYDDIEDEAAIKEIQDINYYLYQLVYESIPKKDFKDFDKAKVEEWYRKGRIWCLDQFETFYKILGTNFDYFFLESRSGEIGYKLVKENIGKIFEEDDGAVIYKGDTNEGLHTRVFINQFGLPTYEAKDIGLAYDKNEKGKWDESIMITGNEQTPYFKVVFDALSKLLPSYAKIVKHIPHGLISLPGMKKMSSRKGEVVGGGDLIRITHEAVKNLMKESNKDYIDEKELDSISLKIAVGAIKYAFLRVSVGKNISFDIGKDIQVDGDTGPYLMYVYTRAKSILDSAEDILSNTTCVGNCLSDPHVKGLIREISRIKEVVLNSAINYSPSTLCTYLFELGQKFNQFYQEVNVLNAEDKDKELLLAVVEATADIMKTGLYILGIETVDRM